MKINQFAKSIYIPYIQAILNLLFTQILEELKMEDACCIEPKTLSEFSGLNYKLEKKKHLLEHNLFEIFSFANST